MPDTTAIIVTHRLATALAADRILVLEDGRIENIGTHDELIRKDETYRKIMFRESPDSLIA